jgi:protein-S-isoprenylcysteine O-methyltransferase Ste14
MNLWFYSIFGALFFSGVFWLLLHYFPGRQDELILQSKPLKPSLMKIHGAAAMAALVILGVMIPSHMRRAWDKKRNRKPALVILSAVLFLILSGYALYYFGGEEMRPWISRFHSIAGCLLPLILLWHITTGRKERSASAR